MKIKNSFGLPETLVRAVMDDEYDRGDAVLSVTQLISSPRIVLLQDLNADNLESDVVDRIPSLLGTAVHKIVEKGAKGLENHIVEERLFATVRGWKISGAVDLQIDHGDNVWEINDYKVTSTYSVMVEKTEWEEQLNLYAALTWLQHGRNVTTLKIVAILRDWQRKKAAYEMDYPPTQVVVVDIPVWDRGKQLMFLNERVRLHQAAREAVDKGEPLPYCTDKERWLRNDVWAVMKKGRKSAIRLHDKESAANTDLLGRTRDHYVERRPGEPVRCSGNYCLVSKFCKQWNGGSSS